MKSINIALLTEGELVLSWINLEQQNNANASPTFNHTRSFGVDVDLKQCQVGKVGLPPLLDSVDDSNT